MIKEALNPGLLPPSPELLINLLISFYEELVRKSTSKENIHCYFASDVLTILIKNISGQNTKNHLMFNYKNTRTAFETLP